MAVVLSARLMVRYVDKYDPDLAAAFEKLEQGLPPAARGARRTNPRRPVEGAARRALQRERPAPDQGLGRTAGRRVRLRACPLRRRRQAAPRDRPAVPARTVAPDTCALSRRLRRRQGGAADVQGRADRERRADAADVRAAGRRGDDVGPAQGMGHHRRPAAGRGRAALHVRPSRIASARRRGTRPRRWRPRRTVRCAGRRPSRARSRSASGSCRGATMSRSSSRLRCGTTWPPRTGGRRRATRRPDEGRMRAG